MPRKKLPEIREDRIGDLYLKPGDDIPYRLIRCDVEPIVSFVRVDRIENDHKEEGAVSLFSDFVHITPDKPVTAPKPPRADKGKNHAKPKKTPICPEHKEPLIEQGGVLRCTIVNCGYQEKAI